MATWTIIPQPLTWEHYQSSFTPAYMNNIKNSLIVSLGTILFTLPIAVLAGYALARFDFPGKRYSVVILVLPLLPAIAVLVPLILYMRTVGPLQHALFRDPGEHGVCPALLHLDDPRLHALHPARDRGGRADRRLRAVRGALQDRDPAGRARA